MDEPRLLTELSARGVLIDTAPRRRAEYAYDASNYRVHPLAVAFPRDVTDVVDIVTACGRDGVPITSRGGGTSMAGNAVGPGLVLDFSRHMNRVLGIDVDAATATVQPGMVLTDLQDAVARASGGRLTFAPDPSSKSRATVGGAIGNDACGNHSVRYGRTSDHVISLDLVTVDGFRLTATRSGLVATDDADTGAAAKAAALSEAMRELTGEYLASFRRELGRIPRQVSGYHLSNLLPENGFDVARALVGSEGTCAVIVAATVALVPVAPAALLLNLGYRDVVDAARDVPLILEYAPAAVEGIDAAIVDTMRHRRGPDSVLGLPEGQAWLYVDLDGPDPEHVRAQADELLDRLRAAGRLVDGRVVGDVAERASLWRVREDGAGLSARLVSGGESWPGWEDSAVAPGRLADYLVEFRELLDEFRLTGVMYGHFGAGCMHVRIDFDLRSAAGREVMAQFLDRAARMCVRFGGSVSGEHGDGRARSQVLPLMYSASVMSAFAKFKQLWDPQALLNPGSIVDAAPATADLALAHTDTRDWKTSFDLGDGGGGVAPLLHAAQGCVGIGRCRAHTGGVMCPSFRATRDEKDSTRGRARVLQEMIRTAPSVEEGWRSEQLRQSLDLCLACKACATDCPTGVDMATYKAEFLDHHYRGRRRPMSHYSLGWLPSWAKLAGRAAAVVNRLAATRAAPTGMRLAGLTTQRSLPQFASRRRLHEELGPSAPDADTVLFVDTFTAAFRPHVAGAARRVLTDADRRVECRADVCCGLTWISTGQLARARTVLGKTVDALDDGTDRPIVVVEPSCAAALRKDLPELVHTAAARRVAERVRSFATAVTEMSAAGWRPPGPIPAQLTVQTHCHEYSTFGATTQRRALAALGVGNVTEATGCCGVAGNFGFEADHYPLSMQVAEQSLAPALRATGPDTTVLTDGFSCRMQVEQLGRRSLHLAELIDPDREEVIP